MSSAGRKFRERMKSGLHDLFVIGQRFGVDILPRHFYSGIPDLRELRTSEGWKRPLSMTGVSGSSLDSQMEFFRDCCTPFLGRLSRGGIHEHACRENGEPGYGSVEADFLYCFIAAKRPSRIVQVGAGVSTAVILLAAEEAGYSPELVCIDPYPTAYLTHLDRTKRIQLVRQRAQEVDFAALTTFHEGGLLFIDSSHGVRPGSEVNRIILEVLPGLSSGVFVHFHDICFPYDYQPSVLNTLFFPTESTLLHAFLVHNRRCSIAVALSMLHHGCSAELQAALPHYRPLAMDHGIAAPGASGDFPSAIYLTVS